MIDQRPCLPVNSSKLRSQETVLFFSSKEAELLTISSHCRLPAPPPTHRQSVLHLFSPTCHLLLCHTASTEETHIEYFDRSWSFRGRCSPFLSPLHRSPDGRRLISLPRHTRIDLLIKAPACVNSSNPALILMPRPASQPAATDDMSPWQRLSSSGAPPPALGRSVGRSAVVIYFPFSPFVLCFRRRRRRSRGAVVNIGKRK